ncbi:hypothetical protein BJ322DRAFT_161406 [Thelephora terrestris]|uniref:Uncharacterized protein n=1 Tax=Thelephora terrestris TaxID=56493 RepID=A0A9P6HBX7_9AGAM|nr:hypothetical protein BJ322DRAFT_161406 [Thelephora terrestris]
MLDGGAIRGSEALGLVALAFHFPTARGWAETIRHGHRTLVFNPQYSILMPHVLLRHPLFLFQICTTNSRSPSIKISPLAWTRSSEHNLVRGLFIAINSNPRSRFGRRKDALPEKTTQRTFGCEPHIGDPHPHPIVPTAPTFSTPVYHNRPYFPDQRTGFPTIMTSLSPLSYPHPCIKHRLRRNYSTAFLIPSGGRTRMTDDLNRPRRARLYLSLRPSQRHSYQE